MRDDASKIIDDLIKREAHFIVKSSEPDKMTNLECRRARRDGRLIRVSSMSKIAGIHDLYQDTKTGEFWKTTKDGHLVRLFKEENGIAQLNNEE